VVASADMSKCSPQVLSRSEVVECAKAIAVMVYRFIPNESGRFYHAHEIAENLGNLPHSKLSALHVEIDTLKKALSNESMRNALASILPGNFEFVRSSTQYDVIKKGPFAFLRGYQIKFVIPVEASSDYNRDIKTLRGSLTEQYHHEEEKFTITVQKKQKSSSDFHSPDYVTPLVTELEGKSNVENGILKKRGRPESEKDDKDLRISRLRNKLNYKIRTSTKSRIAFEEESIEESIGSKLLNLIKEVGSYTEQINGEECMSIVSGLLIQDLISNCGCSVEKLPMIIGTVLTTLLGELDEETYSTIVKSHNTYALASERTALLAVLEVRKRFVDREAENRVLYAWLILDASNKKGKGCVGKIVIIVGFDGVVRQLALRLDTTVTKKALGSSRITIESLETEVGDGIVWIVGITTDAFGAAVEEAALVLRKSECHVPEHP
jgi:hypothetical protein